MNVFARLAAHLPRQEENYLTQTLAAVLDRSPAFRRQFCGLLGKRRALSRASHFFHVRTQERRWGASGHSVLDLILADDRGVDRVAVEVKFAAPVSIVQLDRHRSRLGSGVKLVLLTTLTDVALPEGLSKTVAIVSWSEIFRCAHTARRQRLAERESWLLEELMSFLETKGIAPPDPIAEANWKRISRLAEMLKDGKRTESADISETLPAFATLVARLTAHRDESWGHLRDLGWRPYVKVWRYKDGSTAPVNGVSILAGFYKPPTKAKLKRLVHSYNFGLELTLALADRRSRPPGLLAWWHRATKKRSALAQDGRRRDQQDQVLAPSARHVKKLFATNWDSAHKRLGPKLTRMLRKFETSSVGREAF